MKYFVKTLNSFYVEADNFRVENECIIFFSIDDGKAISVALIPVKSVQRIQVEEKK